MQDDDDRHDRDSDRRIGSGAALAALGRALRADARVALARLGRLLAALVAAIRSGLGRARLGARGRETLGRLSAWRPRTAAAPDRADGAGYGAADEAAEPAWHPEAAALPSSLRPRRPRRRSVWTALLGGAAALGGITVLGLAALLVWALWGMNFSGIARAEAEPTVVMEALDGEMFASKGPFRGEAITADALPPTLAAAVVAIEDRRFRSHPGVDAIGIARAAMANLRNGGVVQGGSTITQQLARVLFLDQERSLKRKIREAALAVWLDATETKDEILARYLSSIYMGAGVWGMPAAAHVYFGKTPGELSLAESAMLAGLIKAPSDLNPRADLEAARARADVVLGAMVETGAITAAEAEAARAEPAALREASVADRSGGWFADWVQGEASALADQFDGALYVRTTLHPRVQRIAEEALAEVMDAEGEAKGASEAALVAMLPDGAVLALVGGRDYEASQFNRATEARRQPGSTFKPFVYFAALREGWTMNDPIEDAPIEIDGWRPENYSGRYRGQVRLAEALALSLNAATVRLANEIGPDRVVDAARLLGIDAELKPTPSLALGTSEVTLLDLTGAYAALLEGEVPLEPWGIVEFGTDPENRYRLGRRNEAATRLGPERDELIEVLRLAVAEGTGRAARLDGFAAGKTGTTQDYRDAWFVGFNGPFVAGVWVGNDDNSPMEGVTGGDLPAKIWQVFMTRLMAMVAEGDPLLRPVGGWEGAATGDAGATAASGGGDALENRAWEDGAWEEGDWGDRAWQEDGGEAGTGKKRRKGKAKKGERGQAVLACNVRACDRAYRSFRRSDCTFQPYSGPRKLCTK